MDTSEKYLVVGCDGFIGRALSKYLFETKINFFQTTRRPGKIKKRKLYLNLSKDPTNWKYPQNISVALMCAGISSIKFCEENILYTRNVNVINTIKLARNLIENGIHVIFLSTNMVFDGITSFSKIDQPLNPKTEYGKQKADVEKELLNFGDSVTVVRFTKIIDHEMPLLRDWIKILKMNGTIYPFVDMVLAPVHLAFAVSILCDVARERISGILQVSSDSDISYANLAYGIGQILGTDKSQIKPIKVSESNYNYNYINKNTTLNNDRLVNELCVIPPTLNNTIELLKGNIGHLKE